MKEKDLFDFNQDLSLVDEVQNLALQKNLDLHEMLSGIAFNLFFALDLDIQNSCRDFCKIYSLWCGEEQNNHLLLTLQNFLQGDAVSELLALNRKRIEWCLESWYEAFPYTKIQLQQIGDDEILLLFKTLIADISKISHCEFKFLILLRELASADSIQKSNLWKLGEEILLSDHMICFIFDNAHEPQVKNFAYWLGNFANAQSKLAFFQYLDTFSKLIERLKSIAGKNKDVDSLLAMMKTCL